MAAKDPEFPPAKSAPNSRSLSVFKSNCLATRCFPTSGSSHCRPSWHILPKHPKLLVYPRKRLSLSGSKSLPSIGFLTVCDHAEQGLFGGLLLLNANGRPLEFHCSAPLRTNRAQEILYGPTLRRYLLGEVLGPALLAKLKVEPLLLCTDQREVLGSREFHSFPTLFVVVPATPSNSVDGAATPGQSAAEHGDNRSPAEPELISFKLGKNTVAVESTWASDQDESRRRWEPYLGRIDLAEPFTRIRDAIDEARKAA